MRIAILTVCFIYGLSAFATEEQFAREQVARDQFEGTEAVQTEVTQSVFAQSAFDHIQQLEQDFRVLLTALLEDDFNTAGFYKNVVEPLNSGAELNQAYLQDWELRNSKIRSDRFKIWEEKQFYIVALIHAAIHQAAPYFLAGDPLADELVIRFTADLKKLDKLFDEWESASHFSQENINPKDQRKRSYGFADYVIKAREILQYVGQAPGFESLPHSSTALKGKLRLSGALGYLGGQLIVRSSANALNHINPFHYILPHQWRRNIRKVLFRNYTPFNNNGGISGLFKGLKEIRGLSVELVGQENLARVPLKGIRGQKVANLFLPAHRSDTADAILMSRLSEEIGSFLMFANPSAFAGNYVLGQMLASLPEFISVGKWRGFPNLSPTEKLIKNLEQERSPNVINYPQGFVATLGELLPINSSFVQKLITPLLARGFEVNVIPLSYEVDSKFLSKTGEVDNIHLQARIHPPLLHSAVKVLAEKQVAAQALEGDSPQTRYFDHFLSTLWLESIREHGELTLAEILERTEISLGINSSLE